MTGITGYRQPVSPEAYESALKSSEVVIYAGHGAGVGAGTDESPNRQVGVQMGNNIYTTEGLLRADTLGLGQFTPGPKPDVSASCCQLFLRCPSERRQLL